MLLKRYGKRSAPVNKFLDGGVICFSNAINLNFTFRCIAEL
jgi:hypothetical protein